MNTLIYNCPFVCFMAVYHLKQKATYVRPDNSGRPLRQEKAVIGRRDTVKDPFSFSISISPLDKMPETLLHNEMNEVSPFWLLTESSATGFGCL